MKNEKYSIDDIIAMNPKQETLKGICYDGNRHVMPEYGPEHIEFKTCWCDPILYYKDEESNNEVWLHKEPQ